MKEQDSKTFNEASNLSFRFIAFFGPDGSGKTTQARLLVNYLQSHGTKTKKVWIRSPHTLAYLFSRFFIKIGFCRTVSSPLGKQTKLPAVHSSHQLRCFWSILELVSVMPVILFRVYMPLFLGYTLVAERYVVDTLVTIAYYTGDIGFLKSRAAKFLLRFIPKNTVFVGLTSDYSTIMKRRGHVAEHPDFIAFQKAGYEMLGNSLDARSIDTSKNSVMETSSQIIHLLEIN